MALRLPSFDGNDDGADNERDDGEEDDGDGNIVTQMVMIACRKLMRNLL